MESYTDKNKIAFTKKLNLLTSKGLKVDAPQKNGNTLYHLAILKNSIPLINKINSFKLDINAKNKNGYTALQNAVMTSKNTQILKRLIELGANTKITTEFNETIYDLAIENEAIKNENLTFLKF